MTTLTVATTGTVSGLANNQQINIAAQNLAALNQGSSAPTASSTGLSSTAGVLWHDTGNNLLKIRDQADANWLTIGGIDETNKIYLASIGGGTTTIASAATVDLGSVPQSAITVSGTTTITGFGSSMLPGQAKVVIFSGALTLTHNGTSLILPGAANIAAVAGDMALVTCIGAGNYRVMYQRASGSFLKAFTGDSGSGGALGLVPAPASGDAAAGKFLKADGTWAAVTSGKFTSSQQVLPSAGATLQVAHGLPASPGSNVGLILHCIIAENGYSVGDEVILLPGLTQQTTAYIGVTVWCDATNVNIIMNPGGALQMLNKGGTVGVSVTLANWKLIVRAWG